MADSTICFLDAFGKTCLSLKSLLKVSLEIGSIRIGFLFGSFSVASLAL